MIRKTTSKEIGESLTFVLSDETKDRHGDVISSDGWELETFRSNPIALFGHDSDFPIGTWRDVRVVGNRLLGRLEMAASGTSSRIDELRRLVEQGVLRAVSVGFIPRQAQPLNPKDPAGGIKFEQSELLEVSLVSVPANPAALSLAKQLKISSATMAMAFGEHADNSAVVRRTTSGEHAESANKPIVKENSMSTLSERIEFAQNDLNEKRDKLAELTSSEDLDVDAVEELNGQIDACERGLNALKASEAKIGIAATSEKSEAPQKATGPVVMRRPLGFPQKEVSPVDLIVRAIVVRGIQAFGNNNKTLDQILDERYPGHEATAIVAKAEQTVGRTDVSGWASELLEDTNSGFLQALTGLSVYPELRNRGVGLNFDGIGTINLPRRNAGGAAGGFVGEGQPIRVGRLTTAAASLSPRKMGVIVPFSRELARRSNPAIEGLVRTAILEDTAATLDTLLLDATSGDAVRPAGLLAGVSAAANGAAGGDHTAVKADFQALLDPFISQNASENITVMMNPSQGLAIAMMDGPTNNANWFDPIRGRVNLVESTHVTPARLIAIRNTDFYTASGDTPEFDISQEATVHMEDTAPAEIIDNVGTPAQPVRSFFQTATIGVRMLLDVSWTMGRPNMVQWIDGTTY